MARRTDRERVAVWLKRLMAADRAHKAWSEKFHVERGEQYFQGQQWDEREDGFERYVINLVYPAIKAKQPSLLFYRPHFIVKARPERADDIGSMAEARAKLREDVLNHYVEDRRVKFKRQTSLALFEAMFKFGLVEVGYSADFVDNPGAGRPILREHDQQPETTAQGQQNVQPERNIESENLFVKRIPASQWRVPLSSRNDLTECDWCGYYEWHYPEDLKRNPRYKNTTTIKTSGRVPGDAGDAGYAADDTTAADSKHRDMVKLWKLWDIRARRRYVFCEYGEKFLLEEPFSFLPFAALAFDDILDQFYPFPPTFNWIPPQNELNETREMQRVHRKRFLRKHVAIEGAIDPDELRKLEENRDGIIVMARRPDAVTPIADAPLDAAVARNIPQTKDDFNEISGITSEERGLAESETATQANILDVRSRVRESLQRYQVAEWLAEVGRLMLMTMQESMTLPMWIKTTVDIPTLEAGAALTQQNPAAAEALAQQAQQEIGQVEAVWRQIVSTSLGDLNYEVSVDVESLSPVTEIQQKQDWNTFLAGVMTNQTLMLLFSLSPALLRKTAQMNGIRSEKDLAELQRAIPMVAMALAGAGAGAGAAAPQDGGPPAGGSAPPPPSEISEQVETQAGVTS